MSPGGAELVAEAVFSLGLVALGIWLAPWRQPLVRAGSPPRPQSRPRVVVPLGVGLVLAVAFALASGGGSALHFFLYLVLVLGPSALLAPFEDLGAKAFGVRDAFQELRPSLVLWARAWPGLMGLLGILLLLAPLVGREQLGGVDEVVSAAGPDQFPWLALLGIGVVPLLEEVLFRGRLLTRLAARLGPTRANWVQAVLFGLAHGLLLAPILTLFGWLLGRARLSGAGLGTLTFVHALHNAVAFSFMALPGP